MKVAVLADIHGNAIALDATIRDMIQQGIRQCILLGDVVMKGPMPAQVMDLLEDPELEILAWIKGNTDLWLDEITDNWKPSNAKEKKLHAFYQYAREQLTSEQIERIGALSYVSSIRINETKILCVHGTAHSIFEAMDAHATEEELRSGVAGVEERLVLCAHSHVPFVGGVDDKLICNAGSIGNSLDGDNRISYAILDFAENEPKITIRRLEYPVNQILEEARNNGYPYLEEYEYMILHGKYEGKGA